MVFTTPLAICSRRVRAAPCPRGRRRANGWVAGRSLGMANMCPLHTGSMGSESNRYVMLCLYGPLEPWFDKTWRPGEIELVKSGK
jgi:hypothetical protein